MFDKKHQIRGSFWQIELMGGGQSPLLSSPQKTMTQNRKCIAVDVLYRFDTSLPHGFIQRFLGKNMKNKNPILFSDSDS